METLKSLKRKISEAYDKGYTNHGTKVGGKRGEKMRRLYKNRLKRLENFLNKQSMNE